MRNLLVTGVLAGLLAGGVAADDPMPKPDAPKKREVTLKVGDPPPPLKADKWNQGNEVKGFESGKVYVVEFWATWCGPCISAMPHLAQLQAEFKDKGVTVIGYTHKDPNNSAEQVEAFVARRGPKLGYTFAYSDGEETNDAWMKAAGRNGIPCTFVVGKDGKLAYIGHPIYLDSVLPKVVDGTWSTEEGPKAVAQATKELMDLNKVVAGKDDKDYAVILKAIDTFEEKNPGMAHAGYFAGQRVDALVKLKRTAEAKRVADAAVAQATKWGDVSRLRAVSAALRADGDKELLALAVKAAEEMVAVTGDGDFGALLNLASTHLAAGDKTKAEAFADKATEAAAKKSSQVKQYVEQQVKKIKDGGK